LAADQARNIARVAHRSVGSFFDVTICDHYTRVPHHYLTRNRSSAGGAL